MYDMEMNVVANFGDFFPLTVLSVVKYLLWFGGVDARPTSYTPRKNCLALHFRGLLFISLSLSLALEPELTCSLRFRRGKLSEGGLGRWNKRWGGKKASSGFIEKNLGHCKCINGSRCDHKMISPLPPFLFQPPNLPTMKLEFGGRKATFSEADRRPRM